MNENRVKSRRCAKLEVYQVPVTDIGGHTSYAFTACRASACVLRLHQGGDPYDGGVHPTGLQDHPYPRDGRDFAVDAHHPSRRARLLVRAGRFVVELTDDDREGCDVCSYSHYHRDEAAAWLMAQQRINCAGKIMLPTHDAQNQGGSRKPS
jgi:hypothetical protein